MTTGPEGTPAAGWTRRGTLAALAASVAAPALPAMAAGPTLPPGLARICGAAVESPAAARHGTAAAAGHTAEGLVRSLLGRLGPDSATDWRGALVRSGRRDIAAGDTVTVLGRPLMRTEAEVLALGVLVGGVA